MGDHNDAFMRGQNAAVQARTKVQNRANVQQLKLIGQSHATGLTVNLLKLFEPRPPLEYKPLPEKRKCPPYTGMAQFVSNFAEPGDPEYAPPVQEAQTPAQKKAKFHKLLLEKGAEMVAEGLKNYDPNGDPNISGDPYKTLFVARLNYETSESRIKREFELFGPIKRVHLISDKVSNKPRGYAFVEYVHTRDMKAAYKQADGKKIDGRRVIVDVERGRTVPNWHPRRLGGGLGTTRIGGEDVNQREQLQSGPSHSEEPRLREDWEKSHERAREQERSHVRSHDRPRDRDREDRHHRERERRRDREREREREKERDRGQERDRGRECDRGRDHGHDYERQRERDRDRDHLHKRERDRDRDYEVGEQNHDHRRSRDRESDNNRVDPKHGKDRHGESGYDVPEEEHGWYEKHDSGHRRSDEDHNQHYEHRRGRGDHDHLDAQGDHDRYDQMEDDYHYDHDRDRTRDLEHEYRRSGNSRSREYDN